jgi:hypothetical protein
MKYLFSIFIVLHSALVYAQPKTDCVCSGSTAGGARIYAGAGADFHLMSFVNDEQKYSISTLGMNLHAGYNLHKSFSLQLVIQKYSLSNEISLEKSTITAKYSYLDLSFHGVYRFIKRGSRFIPYVQGGYTMNSTLKKEIFASNDNSVQKGFSIHGNYAHLGGGTLFVLANQFTLFGEAGFHLHPKSIFNGTYVNDIFRMKFGLSIGVNYHF